MFGDLCKVCFRFEVARELCGDWKKDVMKIAAWLCVVRDARTVCGCYIGFCVLVWRGCQGDTCSYEGFRVTA